MISNLSMSTVSTYRNVDCLIYDTYHKISIADVMFYNSTSYDDHSGIQGIHCLIIYSSYIYKVKILKD
jgi:hypothetical protein